MGCTSALCLGSGAGMLSPLLPCDGSLAALHTGSVIPSGSSIVRCCGVVVQRRFLLACGFGYLLSVNVLSSKES